MEELLLLDESQLGHDDQSLMSDISISICSMNNEHLELIIQ